MEDSARRDPAGSAVPAGGDGKGDGEQMGEGLDHVGSMRMCVRQFVCMLKHLLQ